MLSLRSMTALWCLGFCQKEACATQLALAHFTANEFGRHVTAPASWSTLILGRTAGAPANR